jgi:hypothetical protein
MSSLKYLANPFFLGLDIPGLSRYGLSTIPKLSNLHCPEPHVAYKMNVMCL